MRIMWTPRASLSALIALVLVVGIAGFVGYGLGLQAGTGPRMSEVKTFRDVPAYVGDAEVSATVDGATYGAAGQMAWVDASGSYHDGGWPTCIPFRTQSRITFGGSVIYGPTGTGSYRIVWVDCR